MRPLPLKVIPSGLRWTPKTGQGPKVENRCLKEKTWDSGNSTQQASKRRWPWKLLRDSGRSRNWGRCTGFIQIKSRLGKGNWWRKLPKFLRAAGFTAMKPSRKKRRSCISRSESCRWNWTGFKKSLGSCDAERETGMYRNGTPALEHRAAMRVDRPAALELVLRAAKRERREFAADAVAGRTVHADTRATTHAADGR